jgi:hypothetical protein
MILQSYSRREAIASNLFPQVVVNLKQDTGAQRQAIGKDAAIPNMPPRLE